MKTPEPVRLAVDATSDGLFQADDGYVFMSMDLFREVMGVGSDEGLQASLSAIREGLADVEAGRTQEVGEFFAEFDQKHGLSS